MTKSQLISQILKQEPNRVYWYKRTYMTFPSCGLELPYAKYANCKASVIGEIGPPSAATIRNYEYSWNAEELNNATIKQLRELLKISKQETIHEKLVKKYANIAMYDLLKTLSTPI